MIPKTTGRRANEAIRFTPTHTSRILAPPLEGISPSTRVSEARALWLPFRARKRGKLPLENNSPPSSRFQRSKSTTYHLRLPVWPRASPLLVANSTKAALPNRSSSRSKRRKSWSSIVCNNKRNNCTTSCPTTAALLITKISTSTDTVGPAQDRVPRGRPRRSFRENLRKSQWASTLLGRLRSSDMHRVPRVG